MWLNRSKWVLREISANPALKNNSLIIKESSDEMPTENHAEPQPTEKKRIRVFLSPKVTVRRLNQLDSMDVKSLLQ